MKYVLYKSHGCAPVGKTIFLGVSFRTFATSCARWTLRKEPRTPVSRSRYNIRSSDFVCSQTTTSGARGFGAVLRDFHDIYTLRVGRFPVGNGYRLTRFHFFVSYFKQNERGREKALPTRFINSRLVRAQNHCRSFSRTKFRYPKKCNP